MEDEAKAVEVDQLVALLTHPSHQAIAYNARAVGVEEVQRQDSLA